MVLEIVSEEGAKNSKLRRANSNRLVCVILTRWVSELSLLSWEKRCQVRSMEWVRSAVPPSGQAGSSGPVGSPQGVKQPSGRSLYVPWWGRLALGSFLLLLGVVLVYLLLALWPAVQAATSKSVSKQIQLFGTTYKPTPDTALLLLVISVSALGSYVHVAISFADFVGNRRLEKSWIWWYLLRIFIGIVIAVLFYFALRGGFLASNTQPSTINPYGIAALAGLSGLFSKQATDKLHEVFDTLFRTGPGYGDDVRGGKITNPKPILVSVDPTAVPAGSGGIELKLKGSGFMPQSVVRIESAGAGEGAIAERPTTYVSATDLRVSLIPADTAEAGIALVSVFNPPPDGGTAEAIQLRIG